MTLAEILAALEGQLVSAEADMSLKVDFGCGADLMSDVLAFSQPGTLLLTGLTNPQVVRTADMADVRAIVFVRGKVPPSETVALAREKSIPLMATRYTLYESCGRLYAQGLPSCGVFTLTHGDTGPEG